MKAIYKVLLILMPIMGFIFTTGFILYSEPQYINSEEFVLPSIESDNLLTLYRYYHNLERFQTEDYASYVLDPNDDEYLLTVFPQADIEFVNYIVENIEYEEEEGEYPKFPIETLYEGKGDCEDRAILGASILALHGYDVSLVKDTGHMVIKVGNEGFIPGEVEVLEEYPITERPIVFHYWGEILKKKTPLKSTFEGEIYVENRGNKAGNITLSISGETKSAVIAPFSKVVFDFKVNKEVLETSLYLEGAKVDENKSVDN